MARVRVKIKDIPPKETTEVSAPVASEVPAETPVSEELAQSPGTTEHQTNPQPAPFEEPAHEGYSQPTPATQRPAPAPTPHHSGITVSSGVLILAGAIFLAVVIGAIILLNKNDTQQNSQNTANVQPAATTPEAEALKYHEEISKYVDVPQGQTPSLVAVSDPAKLAEKSPVLFKNAQKDDVVLFYLNSDKTGKAVLYRPSTKKLVALVDGVNLNSAATGSTSVPTPTPGTNR